jgi:hypothetical protein
VSKKGYQCSTNPTIFDNDNIELYMDFKKISLIIKWQKKDCGKRKK